MSSDDKDSSGALPSGQYSTEAGQYSPPERPSQTGAAASVPADAVRVVAVGNQVTVSYDAREQATRRMIRRINES